MAVFLSIKNVLVHNIGIILAVPLAVMIQELMESWADEKIKRKSQALA